MSEQITREQALAVLQNDQRELSQRIAEKIDAAIKTIQDEENCDLEQVLMLGNVPIKAPQGSIIWNITRRTK